MDLNYTSYHISHVLHVSSYVKYSQVGTRDTRDFTTVEAGAGVNIYYHCFLGLDFSPVRTIRWEHEAITL